MMCNSCSWCALTYWKENAMSMGLEFCCWSYVKGILPEILEELLAARKRAKADLKEGKDHMRRLYCGRSSAGSENKCELVYGFTGATVGQLPCLEISSSMTSYGRQMIEYMKKLVEDKFTTLGGYHHNTEDMNWIMFLIGPS